MHSNFIFPIFDTTIDRGNHFHQMDLIFFIQHSILFRIAMAWTNLMTSIDATVIKNLNNSIILEFLRQNLGWTYLYFYLRKKNNY